MSHQSHTKVKAIQKFQQHRFFVRGALDRCGSRAIGLALILEATRGGSGKISPRASHPSRQQGRIREDFEPYCWWRLLSLRIQDPLYRGGAKSMISGDQNKGWRSQRRSPPAATVSPGSPPPVKIAAEIAAPGNLNLSKKSATVRSIPFPGADPPLSFVRNIPAVTPAHIGGIPDHLTPCAPIPPRGRRLGPKWTRNAQPPTNPSVGLIRVDHLP